LYEFEGFCLDVARRILLAASSGERISLTPKAFDTLIHLVEHHGTLVEKEVLIAALWPHVVVEDNSLERSISQVRKALGETPGENRFIVTEPGRGYRFVAAVRLLDAPEETAETRPTAEPDRRLPPPKALRRASAVAAVAIVMCAAGLVYFFSTRHTSASTRSSLAVMPFTNLTGNPEMDYFGDGMADELIQRLARVPGLKVPARTSTFAYKGQNIDARRIGHDLDVRYVLQGSVRSAADDVRVAVQLVNAESGYHVWSQTYERQLGDIFKLQDEVTGAVAQALSPGVHVGASDLAGSRSPTRNIEAYRAFLQANALVGATESNLERAMALYDHALALDPNFAPALSARATTRLVYLRFGLPMPGRFVDAATDAERAVQLDPTSGSTQAALAAVNAIRGRWLEADVAYTHALASQPNDPAILISRAVFLRSVGKLQDALHSLDTACELAPLSLPALMTRATLYSLLERDEEALRDVDLGLSMGGARESGSGPLILWSAAWRAGRYQEATRIMLDSMQSDARNAGAEHVILLVFESLSDPSKQSAASAALRELRSRVSIEKLDRYEGSEYITLSVMARDLDEAYTAANHVLDRYQGSGAVGPNWALLWTPVMHTFRQDPRFQLFVRRLKLMDYWKVRGPPDNCSIVNDQLLCRERAAAL
jgi:TolB-like protein/DNA-binding winged helix-turn-helix (wHTH) protein